MNPRRILVGWFGLIVLYTAVTQSDAIAAVLGTTTEATKRLSDPGVALIHQKGYQAGQTAKGQAAQAKAGAGGQAAADHLADLNRFVPTYPTGNGATTRSR